MRYGQAMRSYAKAVLVLSALAIVGACADNSAVAPTTEAAAFVAPAHFLKTGYVVAFRVDNSKGATQLIGDHVINIPANAICDLATSGYGVDYWNKSCSPMKGAVVITATVLVGPNGEPMVDFQPAMRFAPTKEVTLFFKDVKGGSKNISIKYCNNAGFCVDESLSNPALAPFRIAGSNNIIGRRLAHFSGYVVAYESDAESDCSKSALGLSTCTVTDGLLRKSGYMVASGEDIKDIMKDNRIDPKKDE